VDDAKDVVQRTFKNRITSMRRAAQHAPQSFRICAQRHAHHVYARNHDFARGQITKIEQLIDDAGSFFTEQSASFTLSDDVRNFFRCTIMFAAALRPIYAE
jgi:hypothetical protein